MDSDREDMKDIIKDRIMTIQDQLYEILEKAEEDRAARIAGKILYDTIMLWRELKEK